MQGCAINGLSAAFGRKEIFLQDTSTNSEEELQRCHSNRAWQDVAGATRLRRGSSKRNGKSGGLSTSNKRVRWRTTANYPLQRVRHGLEDYVRRRTSRGLGVQLQHCYEPNILACTIICFEGACLDTKKPTPIVARLAATDFQKHHSVLSYSRRRAGMLAKAKTIDHTKLLSTEAGLRAVTRWFLQWDVLTQLSLARTVNDAKPRRKE